MLANAVARGGSGGNKQQQNHGYQENRGGPNHNNASGSRPGGNPNNPFQNYQCDICGKLGHSIVVGRDFTRILMGQIRWLTRRPPHTILTLHGMLIVRQQITSWVI
jgi:hypothetical protein